MPEPRAWTGDDGRTYRTRAERGCSTQADNDRLDRLRAQLARMEADREQEREFRTCGVCGAAREWVGYTARIFLCPHCDV